MGMMMFSPFLLFFLCLRVFDAYSVCVYSVPSDLCLPFLLKKKKKKK